MKKSGWFILSGLILIWFGYLFWSNLDSVTDATRLPVRPNKPVQFFHFGEDAGKGNLIGIQPYMLTTDYATERRFYQKLKSYLEKSRQAKLLNEHTVVVFPEHIGTWLVAAGEKEGVFTSGRVNEALQLAAVSNIFSFLQAYVGAEAEDRSKAALFLMKAKQMAEIYGTVFKSLAAEYKVTIIAGSVFLPEPKVIENRIAIGDKRIYNAAFVFYPDGSIDPQVVLKQFPITDELAFCLPGNEIPVFDTSLGRLTVVICADSWYPEVYANLTTANAEIMTVPSYSSPSGLWQTKWQGYNGAPMPADVDEKDIGNITEAEAWLKYSMGGRAKPSSVKLGVNVFLRGDLWDLGDDGHTIVYANGNVFTTPFYDGPQVTVVWKQ